MLPGDAEIGWLVPESLRARWELRVGLSRSTLPKLLSELGTIDLFLHDSEHSFDNQMFEFELATKHLRQGDILMASDAEASAAFDRYRRNSRGHIDVYWADHSLALAVKLDP